MAEGAPAGRGGEGAASRGKVPLPARGQLPPCLRHRGGLKVGLIPDWFVTGLSFW